MKFFEWNDICFEIVRVGILETNCYIVYNKNTKKGCVVDPGGDVDKIISIINSNNIELENIYLTHGHFDHIFVADELKEKTKANIVVFKEDGQLMENKHFNCAYMVDLDVSVKADRKLNDKEIVSFAGVQGIVINTPGHTKGSCCYYLKDAKVLFSGDTLFFENHGRTDLPTGSMSDMVHSIKEILFELPEDVTVYPGHGAFTSIGYEKENMEI